MRNILVGLIVCCSVCSGLCQNQTVSGPRRQPKKGAIITGVCLFGTSWGICAAVSEGGPIIIPIVGPFIQNAREKPIAAGTMVYSGISLAQAIGIALIVRGIVGTRPAPRVFINPHIKRNGGGCSISMALPHTLR